MLFVNTANETVNQIFERAMLQANEARKHDARKRLDFYHDEQLPHLWESLQSKFKMPDMLQPCFVNVVRKVCNNLAQAYQEPPVRHVDGSATDGDIFSEITRTSNLDVKMKLVSRYAKLLKTVLLRPVWRKGKMDLDILTPDVLDIQTGETPEDITTVMITNYGNGLKVEDVTYHIWTADEWRVVDHRGRQLDGDRNPYGVIPFVPVWDALPTSDFWVPGGADLVTVQEAINERLVDLLHVLRFQGFGVMWTRGLDHSGEVTLGPGTCVDLPEEGGLGFESTNAPISEILDSIYKLMAWLAVSNGLSASSLNTEPTAESGISKIISNLEIQEKRRDDVALFRQYEKNLFDVFRRVWNYHTPGRKITDGAALELNFFDPRPTLYVKEQAETWAKLISMGVLSPVDVIMERDPDIKTREDAIEHLELLAEERAKFQELGFSELLSLQRTGVLPQDAFITEAKRRGFIPVDLDIQQQQPTDTTAGMDNFMGSEQ